MVLFISAIAIGTTFYRLAITTLSGNLKIESYAKSETKVAILDSDALLVHPLYWRWQPGGVVPDKFLTEM